MNLRCPKCLYEYDVLEATRDADLIAIIKMQADFAPHSKLIFEYAELFWTTRGLKAAKLLRILTEVRDIWTSEKFAFQKKVYGISKAGMVQALKAVCNKRFEVPLDNHNYLKKVMLTVAEQEAQKRSAEAEKALREKESQIRASARPENPEQIERPASIGDLAKKVPWRRE